MESDDSVTGNPEAVLARQEISPRQRVFDAAVELFAARGFDAVTVRDITAHAGANLAAVNYYFESKENLIRLVFKHAAGPINAMILSRLTEYETSAAGSTLETEPILRALVEPIVHSLMAQGADSNLAQIYAQCLMWPHHVLTVTFDEGQNDELMSRFMNALSRALPQWPKQEIAWALYFASGSIYTSARDNKKNFHFRRYTNNQCDTANQDLLIDRLIQFLCSVFDNRNPSSKSAAVKRTKGARVPSRGHAM